MKSHAFVVIVGIINLLAVIIYIVSVVFKFNDSELVDLLPGFIAIAVALFSAGAFFDISRSLKELEEKGGRSSSVFESKSYSDNKKLENDLWKAQDEIKKAQDEIQKLKDESKRLETEIKKAEEIAYKSQDAANKASIAQASVQPVVVEKVVEKIVEKPVEVPAPKPEPKPVREDNIPPARSYDSIDISVLRNNPIESKATLSRVTTLLTKLDNLSYDYNDGDDEAFREVLRNLEKYKAIGNTEIRMLIAQERFNASKYEKLTSKLDALIAKDDVSNIDSIDRNIRMLKELGRYKNAMKKADQYNYELEKLKANVTPDAKELINLDARLQMVESIDDLNKLIPDINKTFEELSVHPDLVDDCERFNEKVSAVEESLKMDYEIKKNEFAEKVHKVEENRGIGIVELIQEYTNILTEDDIQSISQVACDLYFQNQNYIYNEYLSTIKKEDNLTEIKKVAKKAFMVDTSNVDSHILEDIKRTIYDKANAEFVNARVTAKNDLNVAMDLFEMLGDFKDSESLKNSTYIKSLRSKDYKVMVRTLKKAVSTSDFDYNEFLEALDQVDDFADELNVEEIKTKYMDKYKSINKI